ncbi:MAG: IS30 family transposase, partial [Ruthenibacterium sp.]
MIRRFIPKGTDMNKVTKKQVQIVQDWINNYPRKLLHSTSQIEFTKFLSDLHKSA